MQPIDATIIKTALDAVGAILPIETIHAPAHFEKDGADMYAAVVIWKGLSYGQAKVEFNKLEALLGTDKLDNFTYFDFVIRSKTEHPAPTDEVVLLGKIGYFTGDDAAATAEGVRFVRTLREQ